MEWNGMEWNKLKSKFTFIWNTEYRKQKLQ